MTEREKQIEAVKGAMSFWNSGNIPIGTMTIRILEALAPWLKEAVSKETLVQVNDHVIATMKSVNEHEKRFQDIGYQFADSRLNLDQLFKANETLIDRIARIEKHILDPMTGILTRLQGVEPLPNPQPPKPSLTDRYSVSIMRAAGSKWHEVTCDVDWGEAIECADRWYGDPESQQVQVCQFTHDPETNGQMVYLKRKM